MRASRVLVLGTGGMAGHVMMAHLSRQQELDVVGAARRPADGRTLPFDAKDFGATERILEQVRPDVVVNAVGMLVQASENDILSAILVNGYLPNFLALQGRKRGYRLIHVSTDCVFSGKRGDYVESDVRDAETAYARTKSLGEIMNDRDLTIRTSIIGPEIKTDGTGLFHWFMSQSGSVKGYRQAFWSGVTTLELARFAHAAIARGVVGLYQLTAPGKISKYDLLGLIARVWNLRDVSIEPVENAFSDKSMRCTRTDVDWPVPTYEPMLVELKRWMDERPDWYAHYARRTGSAGAPASR